MAEPQEAAARQLERLLREAGVPAQLEGDGVHWQLNAHAGTRSLRVHCFWYGRAVAGLQLGMNPANARQQLGPSRRAPYEGPEYAVTLKDSAMDRPLEGRSRVVEPVLACARAWLGGASVEQLCREAPFVDELGRAMRTIARGLDTRLRWDLAGAPSYELWVYGEGRSCCAMLRDGQLGCSFFVGQAQVAWLAAPDLPRVTRLWLLDRVRLQELARTLPDLAVEPHAELLDADPAAWHWAHFHERIVDPSDVLAPMRELLEALERSPVARRFFTFSSLDRLCFSASSHYPWVNDGLPVVAFGRKGYVVDREVCDLPTAVRKIEAALEAFPVKPFFGTAVSLEQEALSARLAALGSPLRPRVVQRGAWDRLELSSDDGARLVHVFDCSPGHASAEFLAPPARPVHKSWTELDALVAAAKTFLETGALP